MSPISRFRAARRLAVLAFTALCCLLDFGLVTLRRLRLPTYRERARWLHGWCATALRRLNVSFVAEGELPDHGLIVSNHLSYLDILLLSALHPCLFVSKKEVKQWPMFGWLATLAGTVYIDRERRADVVRANEELRAALDSSVPCVLFPEGTSTDGAQILPFRSSLLQPAIECGAEIIPAHIRYSDPRAHWFGEMPFFAHLFTLLGVEQVQGTVRFSPVRVTEQERKAATKAAYEAVLELAKR